MTLQEFRLQLSARIPRTGVRPFVCDGSPLTCTAFIVGLNPATQLEFWPYWDDSFGYKKPDWFEDYKKERRNRGKSEITPSRRIVERIVSAASPVRCLETNIYAIPSDKIANLPRCSRSTTPFEFLLETIKPKVLLLHGKNTDTELKRILSVKAFDFECFNRVVTKMGVFMVRVVSHFSRGWSFDQAEALGHELGKIVADVS